MIDGRRGSGEHRKPDFFTRDLVALSAEKRIALAIKNPAALISGDLGRVA
jgi:hypothetical protein